MERARDVLCPHAWSTILLQKARLSSVTSWQFKESGNAGIWRGSSRPWGKITQVNQPLIKENRLHPSLLIRRASYSQSDSGHAVSIGIPWLAGTCTPISQRAEIDHDRLAAGESFQPQVGLRKQGPPHDINQSETGKFHGGSYMLYGLMIYLEDPSRPQHQIFPVPFRPKQIVFLCYLDSGHWFRPLWN